MVNTKFDRFTKKARRVLALAHGEAVALEHTHIGTEHLLLGLVREGDGTAARVLTSLGADLAQVRKAVDDIVEQSDDSSDEQIQLTPRTRRVIEHAVREARRLDHRYVNTEHLLLGLLREEQSTAADVLKSFGVSLTGIEQRIMAVVSPGT